MYKDQGAKAPLSGYRILEFGSLIAGPFCTRLLADFGAEVIKIEAPDQGDPMREWGLAKHKGKSLWWPIQSRNKKCVTINLRTAEGQDLVKQLVSKTDIIVENFRPGTMAKWGLDYESLKQINPSIIMVNISGFGQTGPYRDKAGFGSVAEAMGGIRYITGYPDQPPTRTGISLGDSVAAMFGVIGALLAIIERNKHTKGEGQYIDVALYESVFALMESSITEYMKLGFIRERTGSILPGIAPSNIYLSKDGKWIVIGANADNVWKRLAAAMDKPELAEDPRYSTHEARGTRQAELDELINQFTEQYALKELLAKLDSAGVPAGAIYNMEDVAHDPHYQAREMIIPASDPELGEIHIPGVVPKLSRTPGTVKWTGPKLGEHNEEIFKGLLKIDDVTYQELLEQGII